MSIVAQARQEAERRWYVDHTLSPSMAPDMQEAFVKGAVWAREQDTREPSDAEAAVAARVIRDHDAESLTCFDHDGTCCPCGKHDMSYADWELHRARAALLAAQQARRG